MFQTLDVEWANVEAALDFCNGSRLDAEIGLRMAADLWLYWKVRGRYRAGGRRLDAFLRAFLAVAPEPTPARAMATWALGDFSLFTGDFAAARSHFEDSRLVSEQTGADRELTFALNGLGYVHASFGETESAVDLFTRERELFARMDDPAGLAQSSYYLATAVAMTGRLAEARQVASEGLEASERADDSLARGMLDGVLGVVQWLLGEPAAGESSLSEALRVQYLLGHRVGMATSLEGLAWVVGSSGAPERAAFLFGAAAARFTELGPMSILPFWEVHHAACEDAVRARLGDARYRSWWERGHALTREQVVAAALGDAPQDGQRGPTAPTVRDDDELSTRELEVARLAASGLSNPAIADELFVSVATVKSHVSHVLTKLGLESRVQLAAWLAEHDPGPRTPAG
jgi:non-specific serine/threonine protein kinase